MKRRTIVRPLCWQWIIREQPWFKLYHQHHQSTRAKCTLI